MQEKMAFDTRWAEWVSHNGLFGELLEGFAVLLCDLFSGVVHLRFTSHDILSVLFRAVSFSFRILAWV